MVGTAQLIGRKAKGGSLRLLRRGWPKLVSFGFVRRKKLLANFVLVSGLLRKRSKINQGDCYGSNSSDQR